MDIEKVVLKFKMNAKGTHHIAYCEEYPQLQGIGPSEGQATANFWKAFNNAEVNISKQASVQKKEAALATQAEALKASKGGKSGNKKAA